MHNRPTKAGVHFIADPSILSEEQVCCVGGEWCSVLACILSYLKIRSKPLIFQSNLHGAVSLGSPFKITSRISAPSGLFCVTKDRCVGVFY